KRSQVVRARRLEDQPSLADTSLSTNTDVNGSVCPAKLFLDGIDEVLLLLSRLEGLAHFCLRGPYGMRLAVNRPVSVYPQRKGRKRLQNSNKIALAPNLTIGIAIAIPALRQEFLQVPCSILSFLLVRICASAHQHVGPPAVPTCANALAKSIL